MTYLLVLFTIRMMDMYSNFTTSHLKKDNHLTCFLDHFSSKYKSKIKQRRPPKK